MKSHNWWTGGVVSENIYWDNLKALFAPSLLVVTVILYDAVKYLGGSKQSNGTPPPIKRKKTNEYPYIPVQNEMTLKLSQEMWDFCGNLRVVQTR